MLKLILSKLCVKFYNANVTFLCCNCYVFQIRDGGKRVIVLPGAKLHSTRDNPDPIPNLSVQKIDAKVPFGIEIVYKSGHFLVSIKSTVICISSSVPV